MITPEQFDDKWKQKIDAYYDRPDFTDYWAFDSQKAWRKYVTGVDRQLEHARLVEHWLNLSDSKVLVIGSNLGDEAIAYSLRGAEVIGIDLDPLAIQLAKEKASLYGVGTSFLYMDGCHTQFGDHEFDFISCAQVLEHLPPGDQQPMMEEMWRLCKPGGHIWLDTPNQFSWKDHHDTGLPFIHWLPRVIKVPLASLLGRAVPTSEPAFKGEAVLLHHYLSYFQVNAMLSTLGSYQILSMYRGFADMNHYEQSRLRQGRGNGPLFSIKVWLLTRIFRFWNHAWFTGMRLMILKQH